MNDRTVTCRACGWVHFTVTREFAEEAVTRFNTYYENLSPEQQQSYYGGRKASVADDYERCTRCGGPHTNFRESREGDCPRGVTLNPIIYEDEG